MLLGSTMPRVPYWPHGSSRSRPTHRTPAALLIAHQTRENLMISVRPWRPVSSSQVILNRKRKSRLIHNFRPHQRVRVKLSKDLCLAVKIETLIPPTGGDASAQVSTVHSNGTDMTHICPFPVSEIARTDAEQPLPLVRVCSLELGHLY